MIAHLEGYRALGFSIIPIIPPGNGHDGKHPAIAWKRYQTEYATDADLADWFATPMSIGIVTGATRSGHTMLSDSGATQ